MDILSKANDDVDLENGILSSFQGIVGVKGDQLEFTKTAFFAIPQGCLDLDSSQKEKICKLFAQLHKPLTVFLSTKNY